MFNLFDTTATPGGLGGGSPWITIVMLVGMVLVFWLFVIRPQKKQEKQVAQMRDALKVGDEIVTIGGIIGSVIIIKDDKIMIETGNDKTKLTILRSSIKSIESAPEEEK